MKKIQIIKTSIAETTAWRMNYILQPKDMVTMISEIDATAIDKIRSQSKSNNQIPSTYTSFVMKAAALTMKQNPQANRAILGLPFFKKLIQFENIDISVAVEKELPNLPGQAFADTIIDTAGKTLEQISSELRECATCTTENNSRLRTFFRILKHVPSPLSNIIINLPYYFPSLWAKHKGCACWVNSPSKNGADLVFTTWPWPITFSFGFVKERPVVVNGAVQARRTMPIVMVFDRRVMGGGPAGKIFYQFSKILENGCKE